MIDQKKFKRQNGIVDKWLGNPYKGKGTLEAVTGFGKTFVAIIAIQRLHKKYPNANVIVVVPGIGLLNDWVDLSTGHITKHGLNRNKVKVFVINSYIKNTHNCDLLIVDEIHNLGAEQFSKTFELTKYKFILGLTATMERIDGKHDFIETFAPVFDRVLFQEAKREGYISNYKIYNLGLELSIKDSEKYDKIHSSFNNAFAFFKRDFDLAMNCGKSSKAYVTFDGKMMSALDLREALARANEWDGTEEHFYSPKNIMSKARIFLDSMMKRKKFIYTASIKLDNIIKLCNKFKVKTIVFSETSEFADSVATELGKDVCRSVHSNLETEIRRTEVIKNGLSSYKDVKFGKTKLINEAIDSFKTDNGLRVLSTVRKFDEGFDYQKIKMAIMASYNSSKRQDTQRTGRAVRTDYSDINKSAIVINMYIINTQEEKWLREKQKGKVGIKWVTSVDEIEAGDGLFDREISI